MKNSPPDCELLKQIKIPKIANWEWSPASAYYGVQDLEHWNQALLLPHTP